MRVKCEIKEMHIDEGKYKADAPLKNALDDTETLRSSATCTRRRLQRATERTQCTHFKLVCGTGLRSVRRRPYETQRDAGATSADDELGDFKERTLEIVRTGLNGQLGGEADNSP